MHPLKVVVQNHKSGNTIGVYSVCSANEFVIEAAMNRALEKDTFVLIEATSNQVNQFGGYTGMKPKDFMSFIATIASRMGMPMDRIVLGGDHLGPFPWRNEKAETALNKADEMIRQYVLAGFTKIHIDTSMRLGDDRRDIALEPALIAERGAELCKAAEEAYNELKKTNPRALQPVYVVGSEVPVPGGTEEDEGIQVTKVQDFVNTVEVFKKAFFKQGLEHAWEQVIAVVVQPGVEFGDDVVHEYNREAAKDLNLALNSYPDLVFEGHSTDYQTADALKMMVEDGIAVLKVGPALTFALREALFSLNYIENELFKDTPNVGQSNLIQVLEDTMLKNPEHWINYYHGDEKEIGLARRFSLSDRCRYYLPSPDVEASIKRLLKNLKSTKVPLTLIRQFMPVQYDKIRQGLLGNNPEALIRDRIINTIDEYYYAIG